MSGRKLIYVGTINIGYDQYWGRQMRDKNDRSLRNSQKT